MIDLHLVLVTRGSESSGFHFKNDALARFATYIYNMLKEV